MNNLNQIYYFSFMKPKLILSLCPQLVLLANYDALQSQFWATHLYSTLQHQLFFHLPLCADLQAVRYLYGWVALVSSHLVDPHLTQFCSYYLSQLLHLQHFLDFPSTYLPLPTLLSPTYQLPYYIHRVETMVYLMI